MPEKRQRPPVATGGVDAGVVTLPISTYPTTPPAPDQDAAAADPVLIRERLLWPRDDGPALTTRSRRPVEREVSAGRMPPPDVRIGRRACYRPSTIITRLDSPAQRGARGG
jgi:hypothetical protein